MHLEVISISFPRCLCFPLCIWTCFINEKNQAQTSDNVSWIYETNRPMRISVFCRGYNWQIPNSWWRHQMEILFTLLALCAGNSPVTGKFPSQRPVTRGFDVFFDLRLNKRLSKQSRRWWFGTLSRSLQWRRRNLKPYGRDQGTWWWVAWV